jgi:hypothetical protein
VAGFLWRIQCISRDHSIRVPNGRWIERDGRISTLCECDRVCGHLPQGAPVYPHLSPHLSSHLPSLGLCRCFTIHFSSSRQALTVALRAEGPTALWSLCFTLEKKRRDLLYINNQTQTTVFILSGANINYDSVIQVMLIVICIDVNQLSTS